MISNVKEHLIKYGWHLAYQVWRGPCAIDESNEKWATSAQRGMQAKEVQMN